MALKHVFASSSFIITKLQTKSPVRYSSIRLEKIKRLTINSDGKAVEKQAVSHIAGRTTKWCNL